MKNYVMKESTSKILFNLMIVVAQSLLFYYLWYVFYHDRVFFYQKGNWLLLALYCFSICLFNVIYGGFQIGLIQFGEIVYSQSLSSLFTSFILFIISSFVSKQIMPIKGFVGIASIEFFLILFLNKLVDVIYHKIYSPKRALILYEETYKGVLEKLIGLNNKSFQVIESKKYIDGIEKNINYSNFEVIICVGLKHNSKEKLVLEGYRRRFSIYVIPDIYDVIAQSSTNLYLLDTPIIKMNNFGPSFFSKIVKRVFDIIFSLFLLILASPVMLVVAIFIKIQDGGPVFYKQKRVTVNGKIFSIYKFRSMRIDAEKDGVAKLAADNDDRITKVGKVIRACRLDELPQLINILIGDMTVVGPRPERPELIEKILETVPEFNYRLKVKAGLTGYAQVYGKYNTELKDKLLLDLMYIENFSLLLDLKLIFMTVKILFMKESTEGVKSK